jgi:ribosomal protein L40E
MICSKCNKENPPDATFCNSCGSPFLLMPIKKKSSGCLKFLASVSVGIIVLVIILIIVSVNTAKNTTTSNNISSTSSAETTIEEKPIPITASKLAKEYEENELLADKNYKGKLLEISGTIDDIGTDIMGTAYFTLRTDNEYTVQCMVSKEGQTDLMDFKKGDGIKSTKICNGKMLLSIILDYKK